LRIVEGGPCPAPRGNWGTEGGDHVSGPHGLIGRRGPEGAERRKAPPDWGEVLGGGFSCGRGDLKAGGGKRKTKKKKKKKKRKDPYLLLSVRDRPGRVNWGLGGGGCRKKQSEKTAKAETGGKTAGKRGRWVKVKKRVKKTGSPAVVHGEEKKKERKNTKKKDGMEKGAKHWGGKASQTGREESCAKNIRSNRRKVRGGARGGFYS